MTTFYAEADGTVAIGVAAAAFFQAVKAMIPTGTTITVPSGGDVIEETTGTLVGTWGTSSTTVISCTGSGAFAAGVGARAVWTTSAIRGGRRVRGSTFVVPLTTGYYESNGTLSAGAVTAMQTAIENFLVQVPTQARVWSRPRPGLPGAAVQINTGQAPDRVSWLRSRRV